MNTLEYFLRVLKQSLRNTICMSSKETSLLELHMSIYSTSLRCIGKTQIAIVIVNCTNMCNLGLCGTTL